jgi:hypothetical protein
MVTPVGRPPLAWLTPAQVRGLPVGMAVTVERLGPRHLPRVTGRITGTTPSTIELHTTRGEVSMTVTDIRRARPVPALYAPGDPVLLRHVPAKTWRGGVVRAEGTRILVEQLDGAHVWHDEDDLEPADARDPVVPASRRGRVPGRRL